MAGLVGAGCGEGERSTAPEPETPYAAPAAPDGKPVPLGCEAAVPDSSVPAPEGLLEPPGARVIAASAVPRPDDPRITVVEGYVELTPSRLIARMRRIPDVEVNFVEDEEIEAEVLLGDRRSRNFWKVVRTCEVASRFTALVVDARDGAAVGGAVKTQTKKGRRRRR